MDDLLKRTRHELSDRELAQLDSLPSTHGAAFHFWRRACLLRGLDSTTVLPVYGRRECFTALPVGHDRWWCWPWPLAMTRTPSDIFGERVVVR